MPRRLLLPPVWLWALVLIYIVTFSTLSVLKHNAFYTNTFDLGIFSQVLWNTAHGRFFEVSLDRPLDTELVGSYLGNHVRPILLLIAPLAPAGAKTLWLRTYDDLFCYGCDLSLRSYLAWGWGNILRSKLWAAGVNLQRFLAEDCLVFLLPFVLVGLYRQKRRLSFVLSTIYLVVIYLAHSLAFTFPGPRGGFFHASSAVLPFLFAAGADGLEAAVEWAGRRRRWKRQQAQVVFAAAAIAMAVVLSGYVSAGKLAGWRNADEAYLAVDRWLDARGVPNSTKVMVGNAPGFWYYSHRPAVAVPNGDASMLMDAGAAYDAGYVVLDANRPQALADLTASGGTAGLQLVTTFDQGRVQLYQWTGGP